MPTLSILKSKFIVTAKWGGMILAALIGIFILIKVVIFVKELIIPTQPPPPTADFGKLPPIFFPSGIKKNFTYSIDTLTGQLPDFFDRSTVYEMEKSEPDILAVQKATEKVMSLGFDASPEHLSNMLYRWRGSEDLNKSLVLNVNMAAFTLYSSYLTDPNVLAGANLPDEGEAVSTAKNFLETLGLYPADLDESRIKTELFTIQNGVITKTQSLANTNLISVNFFQANIDDLPIVYPTGPSSSMNLVVAGGPSSPQVVTGRFFHQNITDESATYSIKTAEEALEELKKGQGYITSHTGKDLNIVIKKVYLGLYIEGKEQKYILPVVVFEGTSDFMGYVSAVRDEWIDK